MSEAITICTEEEARAKWCPSARFDAGGNGVGPGWNRPHPHDSECLGAKCMAWRWAVIPHQRNLPEADRTPAGYCGLAGAPRK